jgi:AraC-like DNA-binding protein
MNIYCTEAAIRFCNSQLQRSGLSDSEAQKLIGHTLIANHPPLTKKIMAHNVMNIFHTLSDLNYQGKYELVDLDTYIQKDDIHRALCLNSENAVALFKSRTRISQLNLKLFDGRIEIDSDRFYFHVNPTVDSFDFYSVQGIFYSFAQQMKSILGELYNSENIEVAFTQKYIPDENVFCKTVSSNIVTKSDSNYISVPKNMALAKSIYFNPLIQPFIEDQLTKEYAIRLSADPFFDTILRKISDAIENKTDELSISTIANAMNMSRSTLYRSLSERNFTFSQIIEEKRRSMSMDLLVNTSISIGEISDRLGYKNLSAFNRAFKRWFNSTPLAMRKIQ